MLVEEHVGLGLQNVRNAILAAPRRFGIIAVIPLGIACAYVGRVVPGVG